MPFERGPSATRRSLESAESGRTLGRYELLCPIGRGGMATVYVARARGAGGFERLFAIKHARPHALEEAEAAALFLDEARLAALIHHPNVVATHDVGRDEEGRVWIAMDYVQGGRLADLLRAAWHREERLAVGVVLRVLVDVLRGLHAAHELRDGSGVPLQLVHRDVSPQNVMVGLDGVARLVDFGIAKAAARSTVTRAGQLKGKLGYMAPEQLARRPLTRAVDVFAAGVVLWESLTGRSLFRGESEAQTIQAAMAGRVSPPSQLAAELPAALDAVVLRALDRDPARRFATAAQMAEALEALERPAVAAPARDVAACVQELLGAELAERAERVAAAARASVAALPPKGPALPAPSRSRGRAWLVALALLTVAAGAGIAVLVSRPRSVAPRAPASPTVRRGHAAPAAHAALDSKSPTADAGRTSPTAVRRVHRRGHRRVERAAPRVRRKRTRRAAPRAGDPKLFRPLAP